MKELLTGSYGTQDADFIRRANEQLASEDQHKEVLARYTEYINYLSGMIPVWKDIARVKAGSLEVSQIPAKRQEGWVCLTATGLNLIGRIGHALFTKGVPNWREYADRMGQVDWRKSAPQWQGNIIQGQKVMTQQSPLKAAFTILSTEIGLDPHFSWKTEPIVEAQTTSSPR